MTIVLQTEALRLNTTHLLHFKFSSLPDTVNKKQYKSKQIRTMLMIN